MDDFERLVIETSIRSRVGNVGRVALYDRNVRTPMAVFIEAAERNLEQPINLYWIDEGIPGHFCITSGARSVVVFHTRELLLSNYLRNLYSGALSDDLRPRIIERSALKLIAELLLQHGFVDQALQTYARSTFDTRITLLEPTLEELKDMPLNEEYLATWFFGLGHEIGHSLKPSARKYLLRLPALSRSHIAGMVQKYIDLRFPDSRSRDVLKQIIRREDSSPKPKSYASASVVREEALADVFAVLMICESAETILGDAGRLDANLLLFEAILAMQLLMIIDSCRILASWYSDMSTEVENQNLMLSNVALGVRMNLLLQIASDDSAREYLSAQYSSAGIFDALDIDVFGSAAPRLDELARQIGGGVERARAFLTSAEMRDTTLFYSLLEKVRNDPILRYDTAKFVQVARLLRVQSPELEMLASVTE
jgi:hypothetical protein